MAYVHIIVDLCLETWCSCFSINFITTKFIADNVSLNDMRNLLTNNFMILNYAYLQLCNFLVRMFSIWDSP